MTVFGTLLLAGSLLLPLSARAADAWSPGYQYDMRGDVVRDAAGNCLRTAQWSPGNALAMCDPGVVAQRSADKPVRGKEARVTGVVAQVDLAVLQAGNAFAFDEAKLSETGKALLAKIVARHKDDYVARVFVAGYTDRIGNDEYNLKLSQQRADAVKASAYCRRDPGRTHPDLCAGVGRPASDLPGAGR